MKQPRATPLRGGRYELYEDYTYTRLGLWSITVPKGFIWDGASIPRWLWSITGMRPDGLIRAAALIHDYFYRIQSGEVFNRKEADVIFYEIAREAGCSWWTAWRAYRAVRLFGWRSWKKQ